MRPRTWLALCLCLLSASSGCALSHGRPEDPPEDPPPEPPVDASTPPDGGTIAERRGIGSSVTLGIDATSLFWLDVASGAVMRAERGAAAATTTRRLASATPDGELIAVSDREVAWADAFELVHLRMVRREGGEAERLSAENGGACVVAGRARHLVQIFPRSDGVYRLEDHDLASGWVHALLGVPPATSLLAREDDYIGTSCEAGGVWRLLRDGTRSTLASGTTCPGSVVIDGEAVYFADTEGARTAIYRAIPSAEPQRILGTDVPTFTVRGGFAYAVDAGHLVERTPDGTVNVLAPATNVHGIAVDDHFVYWTERQADATLALEVAALP